MAPRMTAYEYVITTNTSKVLTCLLPAMNYMDAVSKLTAQGYIVSTEGVIVPQASISDFRIKQLEGLDAYVSFTKANEELLKGLRLL